MLIDDFNQIIEDKVDEIQQNLKLDLRKGLNNNDLYYHMSLFLKLMNFKYRIIYGKSYYIRCSNELKKTLLKIPNEYIRNFHKILEIICSSGNLAPYQSKKSDYPDFDVLFNNYKINHVHLSSKRKNNSIFMERSDYLLFFITYGDTLYLIDIVKHKDISGDKWIDKKYPRIVVNNWPFIYESNRLRNVKDAGPKRNRKEEFILSKNFTLIKEIDGNAYLPYFSGIAGNGVPTQYVMFNHFLLKEIYKLEDNLNDKNYIKNLGFSCSKNCEFKLKLINNKLYLFEENKNEYLKLNLPEIF